MLKPGLEISVIQPNVNKDENVHRFSPRGQLLWRDNDWERERERERKREKERDRKKVTEKKREKKIKWYKRRQKKVTEIGA